MTATATTSAATATQSNWTIDPAHSSLSFGVRHLMFAKVRGRFSTLSGTAKLDERDPSRSSVQVEIDAASIDTGVADRDKHLRSADFFDVEKFPKIDFVSTRIDKIGGEKYRVSGKLSMHGTTRDLGFELDCGGSCKDPWGKERMGFSARTELSRGDFGLKWNQALETGGVVVGDKVEIDIEVELVKA